MQLSIIVPVYNMASDGKLNFCLDSLINQTITDYEIIAVDDCSTDHSLQILKEYEEKYNVAISSLTDIIYRDIQIVILDAQSNPYYKTKGNH